MPKTGRRNVDSACTLEVNVCWRQWWSHRDVQFTRWHTKSCKCQTTSAMYVQHQTV